MARTIGGCIDALQQARETLAHYIAKVVNNKDTTDDLHLAMDALRTITSVTDVLGYQQGLAAVQHHFFHGEG